MRQLTRVYHPYDKWEELRWNMWGETFVERDKWWLELATKFTSNHKLYGSYMFRVITEWPISCENALTDRYIRLSTLLSLRVR